MRTAKEWVEHVERSHFEWWKGNGPTLLQFVKDVQSDALEEAALECEDIALTDDTVERATGNRCARAIRKLKEGA